MFGFPRYSQAGTDQRGHSSRFGSYRREGLRYESDTTDAEWFVMERLLPEASALGRPRATDLRTVMNAILYIASTGCQWRQLPKDFPPYSTVQGYFYAWSRG
jgi:transposase